MRAAPLLVRVALLGAAALASSGVPAAGSAAIEHWIFLENVPGSRTCAARRPGPEIDTMLSFDGAGRLLLMAGRPDWQASGPERIGLRIDDYQAGTFTARASGNLMIVAIGDPDLITRLSGARNLYWYLPSGQYHASIAGFKGALAWLRTCRRDKQR